MNSISKFFTDIPHELLLLAALGVLIWMGIVMMRQRK